MEHAHEFEWAAGPGRGRKWVEKGPTHMLYVVSNVCAPFCSQGMTNKHCKGAHVCHQLGQVVRKERERGGKQAMSALLTAPLSRQQFSFSATSVAAHNTLLNSRALPLYLHTHVRANTRVSLCPCVRMCVCVCQLRLHTRVFRTHQSCLDSLQFWFINGRRGRVAYH